MSYIQSISCATCHGTGSQKLWENLMEGVCQPQLENDFYKMSLPNRNQSKTFLENFVSIFCDLVNSWTFNKNQKVGLIFASTKGTLEDEVWKNDFSNSFDPFTPVVSEFVKKISIPFTETAILSNACTSSHGALELAQRWLDRKICDEVLVLSGDLIGPFTLKGFTTLRSLSPNGEIKPFDKSRDGLILGDGLAALLLSREKKDSQFKLNSVYSLCEGISATRPDVSGKNLSNCYKEVSKTTPDLVIAHGTGTLYNDQTESQALIRTFSKENFPLVTCSKWSVGHSLGGSGLIDLALALKVLEHQAIPGLANLEESDLEIAPWLVKKSKEHDVKNVLISSLGFGGMCSALSVSLEGF